MKDTDNEKRNSDGTLSRDEGNRITSYHVNPETRAELEAERRDAERRLGAN